MSSPLQALMVIPMALIILLVVFLAVTFQNTLSFGENNLGTANFQEIQPQMKQTHYHQNGTFTTTLKSTAWEAVTIKEIILTDKIYEADCKILPQQNQKNFENIKHWGTINITANCPPKTIDDLYTITARITYKINKSVNLKEEAGEILGDVEK